MTGRIEHVVMLDIEEPHAPPSMNVLKIEYIGAGGVSKNLSCRSPLARSKKMERRNPSRAPQRSA